MLNKRRPKGKRLKFFCRERRRVIKALDEVAADLPQKFHLLALLHPLGHDGDAQLLGHLHHRTDHNLSARLLLAMDKKAAIQLEAVDLQLFQSPREEKPKPKSSSEQEKPSRWISFSRSRI